MARETMNVLVVDDSSLFRRVITEALKTFPEVETISQAPNGRQALQKLQALQPDLITLDMEMPEMDGLAVLEALKTLPNPPIVIVLSTLTHKGGHLAIKAMKLGAFDFITKPSATNAEQSLNLLREELAPRLKALRVRVNVRQILHAQPQRPPSSPPSPGATAAKPPATSAGLPQAGPAVKSTDPAAFRNSAPQTEAAPTPARQTRLPPPEMVLIGVSTGGPNALDCLIPALPATLAVPVLIVQHMPPIFTKSLAEHLAERSALKVYEAEHDRVAEPGSVYIAPGGRHMRLARSEQGQKIIQITDAAPENHCRPSVDYLFRSAATHFPGRAIALILTGMGSDGTLGLRLLKRQGCFVIAQDEASCVVYGMPKVAIEAGVVDSVLPLDAIADRVIARVSGRDR
ncbi:protein-glutamate methylesterase/protein-glutamine glutaminase [Halochromatium roseum]|uniref:protein-glutamate methylesterase/protein-glutamine glutaminase n=1 Tax=Halochromatium roseum TaxID=391920 RepID=UPI0019127B7F|nr:chemotaxis response regulator protein-glutamate methylesterase [Halochromatium roseum]MBK5938720.1 hypothetical protein [Halochromatium roseum]